MPPPPPLEQVIVEEVLPGEEEDGIEIEGDQDLNGIEGEIVDELLLDIPMDEENEEEALEEQLNDEGDDDITVETETREAIQLNDPRWGDDDEDDDEIFLFDMPPSPIPGVSKSIFWTFCFSAIVSVELRMQVNFVFPRNNGGMETVAQLRKHMETNENVLTMVSPIIRAIGKDYVDWKYGPVPPQTLTYTAFLEPKPRTTRLVEAILGEPLEESYMGSLYLYYYGEPYPTIENLPLVQEPLIGDIWEGFQEYKRQRFEEFKKAASTLPDNYYYPYATTDEVTELN